MKKGLALLLAMAMFLSLFNVSSAWAAGSDFQFDTSTKTITGYTGSGGDVVIPDSIGGVEVKIIGNNAFRNRSNLTSVTIPNSVTSIGSSAFYNCSSLTSVTIPDSVTSIGNSAFSGCSSLTEITIPNSVTSIGTNAFYYCSNLTEINVDSNNVTYSSEDGVLFDKNKTVLITYPYGRNVSSYTIPDSVTSIGDGAFYYCSSLTKITIPNSVTSIGNYAFSGCSSLTEITIPNSVTSIDEAAFSYCSSLTSATIPNSVTYIGYSAFYGCSSLTSVIIPNSVTSIGSSAFSNCPNLTIYGNAGSYAETYANQNSIPFKAIAPESDFEFNTSTKTITGYTGSGGVVIIPDSIGGVEVKSIGSSAFYNCSSLISVTIPDSVTSIGNHAFYNCSSLTSVTIPNSVTSIGGFAFRNCSSLTSVTIPNSVTSIGNNAFSSCSSLTSVTIPNSVTYIGNYAFSSCSSLTSVTIPNSVTSIGYSAFMDCSSLTSVTIPNSVTSIGDFVFRDCSSLTSVTIPNSVTSIGDDAFSYCSSLTSVTIPNSVTSIGNNAFSNCSSLTSVTIPNSVTSIGNSAFSGCSSLTSVTIPNSVTSIGYSAFYGCSSLTSITIPNSVTSIDNYAFSYCSSLTSITIPNSVTSIGSSAFWGCSSLTSVTIPNSVTSIGNYAFLGCPNLTVYGNAGSYAETYANQNSIPFKAIEEETDIDDPNFDFAIDRVIVKYKTPKAFTPGSLKISGPTTVNGIEISSIRLINPSKTAAMSQEVTALLEQNQNKLAVLRLKTPGADNVEKAIEALRWNDDIAFVERDFKMTAFGLESYNTEIICAPTAWEFVEDNNFVDDRVTVAVIDSGLDPNLFNGKLFINTSETENGTDTDGNGYTDDLWGYNFADKTGGLPTDLNGHGSQTAGVITNVNPYVKLVSLNVFGSKNYALTSDVIEAVNYATNMGIPVTNNSYGTDNMSKALRDTIADGGLFIAAAGNTYGNNDHTPIYPASYQSSNIISVTASDMDDALAYFSNYGEKTVHIAAPGVDIPSVTTGGGSVSVIGTSIAAAHVSSAAALTLPTIDGYEKLFSETERDTALPEYVKFLKARLLDGAESVAGLSGKVSHGRLNLHYAVNPDSIPDFEITVSPQNASIEQYGQIQMKAKVGSDNVGIDQSVKWSTSDPAIATIDENGLVTAYSQGLVTITAGKTLRGITKQGAANVTVSGIKSPIIFEDTAFKQAVIDHLAVMDSKYNDYSITDPLYEFEVKKLTDFSAPAYKINNVKGIEYLTNLETLNLGSNDLQELDLRGLKNLRKLNVQQNKLTSINLAELDKLEEIDCSYNNLSELDISGLLVIESLDCNNNNLETLTTGLNNKNLKYLRANNNSLNSLNTLALSELSELNLDNNKLSVLNVASNEKLKVFSADYNLLETADFLSNIELESLSVANNDLKILKITNLSKLNYLNCVYNSLDISNGSMLLGEINALKAGEATTYYEPQIIIPEKIMLNPSTNIIVDEKSSVTIKAATFPDNASQNILWESADTSIAKVENGIVTGMTPGSTTVKAFSAYDLTVSDSVYIEVKAIGVLYIELSDGTNIVADNGKFKVPLIIKGISDIVEYTIEGEEASNGLYSLTPQIIYDDKMFECGFESDLLKLDSGDFMSGGYVILERKKLILEDGVIGHFILTPTAEYLHDNYQMSINFNNDDITFDDGNSGFAPLQNKNITLERENAHIYGKSLYPPTFATYEITQTIKQGDPFVAPTAKTDNQIPALVTISENSRNTINDLDVPGNYEITFIANDPDALGLDSLLTVNITITPRVNTPTLEGSTDGSRKLTINNTDDPDTSYRIVIERSTDNGYSWFERLQISSSGTQKVEVSQKDGRSDFLYRAYGKVVHNGRVYKSEMSNTVSVKRHNQPPILELTGDSLGDYYYFGQTFIEPGVGARAFDAVTKEPLETGRITKIYNTTTINGIGYRLAEGKVVPSPVINKVNTTKEELDEYEQYITTYSIQYTIVDDCGNTQSVKRIVYVCGELGDLQTGSSQRNDFRRTTADYLLLRNYIANGKADAANPPLYEFHKINDAHRANLDGLVWDGNLSLDIPERITLNDVTILNQNVLNKPDFTIEQLLKNMNEKRMSSSQQLWEKVLTP